MSSLESFFRREAARGLRAIRRAGCSCSVPELVVIGAPRSGSDWGGKFEPGSTSRVVLYPSTSPAINRAIVVHELAHWVRHHTGDTVGYHDGDFCLVVTRMYRTARVGRQTAMRVERSGGCLG